MELVRDRLILLLRAIKEGPNLTLGALVEETRLSRDVLSPDYPSDWGEDTVARIARGAAKLLELKDATQLLAWLYGARDRTLKQYFDKLLTLYECTTCHHWFTEGQMVAKAKIKKCYPCYRDENSARMFQQRLASDPKLQKKYEALWARVPAVEAQDPKLHAALVSLWGQAINRPKVARTLGVSLAEAVRRLAAVGLIGLVAALSPARVQARPARPPVDAPQSRPHNLTSGGRGRGSRRKQGAASSADPSSASPKKIAKKKGRRGRSGPPEGTAEKVSAAVRSHREGLAGGRRAGTVTGQCVLFAEQAGDR